ncbi:MAG: hypothetical protein CMM06_01950 [Rhodopirellula sp.]|nr:hypothetical protein [Rhodopirellula sp.]MCH2597859.1 hypothetical protein [Pirellulales bacterium]|tara:strand:- start:9141 stop:10139 length:999 start_codon:yes stop_codon:yes gene_type:complete
MRIASLLGLFLVFTATLSANADDQWITFEGKDGPGKGKHIVFVSGDDEYRSEEALPLLAKIMAEHHGFKCTVLFAIDPATGAITPSHQTNIPGLEALEDADLAVFLLRFRNLPDDQMKYIADYTNSGKPIIGMRTSTHAFNIPGDRKYHEYSFNYNGEYKKGWGRQVLGETWINHHGHHGRESTGGVPVKGKEGHPILRGCKDIWGDTDVYGVTKLEGDSDPILLGAVLDGMTPDAKPVEGKKNEPMMPVAWVKSYKGTSGKTSTVFNTTMGAATDLVSEGTRRMLVNSMFWCLEMEDAITADLNVSIVGDYKPTKFGFGGFRKGLKPSDYK